MKPEDQKREAEQMGHEEFQEPQTGWIVLDCLAEMRVGGEFWGEMTGPVLCRH